MYCFQKLQSLENTIPNPAGSILSHNYRLDLTGWTVNGTIIPYPQYCLRCNKLRQISLSFWQQVFESITSINLTTSKQMRRISTEWFWWEQECGIKKFFVNFLLFVVVAMHNTSRSLYNKHFIVCNKGTPSSATTSTLTTRFFFFFCFFLSSIEWILKEI